MSIEELENKHGDIPLEPLNFDEFYYSKHTKLSIKFAISVLYEVQRENELSFLDLDLDQYLGKKIQELKQYLNDLH